MKVSTKMEKVKFVIIGTNLVNKLIEVNKEFEELIDVCQFFNELFTLQQNQKIPYQITITEKFCNYEIEFTKYEKELINITIK